MKKSLRETFTELILSSQEQAFKESSERDTHIESPKGVITVCVGVRRCGKSTLMERRMAELASENFAHSKEYLDDALNARREAYFSRIKQELTK